VYRLKAHELNDSRLQACYLDKGYLIVAWRDIIFANDSVGALLYRRCDLIALRGDESVASFYIFEALESRLMRLGSCLARHIFSSSFALLNLLKRKLACPQVS